MKGNCESELKPSENFCFHTADTVYMTENILYLKIININKFNLLINVTKNKNFYSLYNITLIK